MDLTMFFAQVLGLYLVVGSVGALLNPKRLKKASDEFQRSYLLPYFDGSLALLFGLVVVALHWNFDSLTASLITIIGALGVLEGLMMFLLPQKSISEVMEWMEDPSFYQAFSWVGLIVGLYLAYMGFGL